MKKDNMIAELKHIKDTLKTSTNVINRIIKELDKQKEEENK